MDRFSKYKKYKKFSTEIFVILMLAMILIGVGAPTLRILEANEWFDLFK
jgi:hypothetical protein